MQTKDKSNQRKDDKARTHTFIPKKYNPIMLETICPTSI